MKLVRELIYNEELNKPNVRSGSIKLAVQKCIHSLLDEKPEEAKSLQAYIHAKFRVKIENSEGLAYWLVSYTNNGADIEDTIIRLLNSLENYTRNDKEFDLNRFKLSYLIFMWLVLSYVKEEIAFKMIDEIGLHKQGILKETISEYPNWVCQIIEALVEGVLPRFFFENNSNDLVGEGETSLPCFDTSRGDFEQTIIATIGKRWYFEKEKDPMRKKRLLEVALRADRLNEEMTGTYVVDRTGSLPEFSISNLPVFSFAKPGEHGDIFIVNEFTIEAHLKKWAGNYNKLFRSPQST
jgi:hypothetical protein